MRQHVQKNYLKSSKIKNSFCLTSSWVCVIHCVETLIKPKGDKMDNLEDSSEFDIQNGKLVLETVSKAEIPLIKILYVNFEDDSKNPFITIKMVDGANVTFRVKPEAKQRIKDLINDGRAEIISLEFKKR
jgi:hypothetical protein